MSGFSSDTKETFGISADVLESIPIETNRGPPMAEENMHSGPPKQGLPSSMSKFSVSDVKRDASMNSRGSSSKPETGAEQSKKNDQRGGQGAAASMQSRGPRKTLNRDPRRIVIIFIASFLELIAASYACDSGDCEEERLYAVLVGLVSLISCGVYVIYLRRSEEPKYIYTQSLSLFLFIWWTFGVIVCTFVGPFRLAGNGYFATWVAAGESAYFAFAVVPALEQQLLQMRKRASQSDEQVVLCVMLVAGVVEVAAAADLCEKESCEGNKLFAVIVGAIVTMISLVSLTVDCVDKAKPLVSGILGVFIFIGTWVLTFEGPFTEISNGFFSTWTMFCSSCTWAYIKQQENNFVKEYMGVDPSFAWLKRADSIITRGTFR